MIKHSVDTCNGCGLSTLIQNKKYLLCSDCVFKKNHGGKSKTEIYQDRANGRDKKPTVKKESSDIKELKKTYSIKKVGTSKRFRCSDGKMVSQVDINNQLTLVHELIKQDRPPICQGSGKWCNDMLSFSHTISTARCKKLNKTELIWDVDNIELEEFQAPTSNPTCAHNIWESGSLEKKINLLNFERKLQYIKKHDSETYNKLKIKLDEVGYSEG